MIQYLVLEYTHQKNNECTWLSNPRYMWLRCFSTLVGQILHAILTMLVPYATALELSHWYICYHSNCKHCFSLTIPASIINYLLFEFVAKNKTQTPTMEQAMIVRICVKNVSYWVSFLRCLQGFVMIVSTPETHIKIVVNSFLHNNVFLLPFGHGTFPSILRLS